MQQKMKVYKFGGASVASASAVRNVGQIITATLRGDASPLFIVVSAMGKTTNALEEVVSSFMRYEDACCDTMLARLEHSHREIIQTLFAADALFPTESSVQEEACSRADRHVVQLFEELRALLLHAQSRDEYDYWYDQVVSCGELLSSVILSEYLTAAGISNRWVDMRRLLVTDGRFREANIQTDRSSDRLHAALEEIEQQVIVAQGFIGATLSGKSTTLGREGSDYSAAMVAYLLEAESVTIWKDVEGVLSADPHRFEGAVHIPQLTYLDAVELAYSGAQIIHPKTIKPLQNGGIPLYVKSFLAPDHPGTEIRGTVDHPIGVPMLILKQHQVLVSLRPKDFSFVLEDSLADIFRVFIQYRQRINLIQSSAVNLSVCIDDSRYIERVVDILQADFRVVYNRGLELLTIRGYDAATYQAYAEQPGVFLVQKTRRTARILREEQAE